MSSENLSVSPAEVSFNELFNRNLQVSHCRAEDQPVTVDARFPQNADKPAEDSQWTGKDAVWKKPIPQADVPDKCAEDSNKLGLGGGSGDVNEKMKSAAAVDVPTGNAAVSEISSKPVSRKLILDKIETEKRRGGRRRRSGSGARLTGLTSEEFDELYRLPTEHLRKDRQVDQLVCYYHFCAEIYSILIPLTVNVYSTYVDFGGISFPSTLDLGPFCPTS